MCYILKDLHTLFLDVEEIKLVSNKTLKIICRENGEL